MIINFLNKWIKYFRFSPLLLSYWLKGRKTSRVQEDIDQALIYCHWHASSNRTVSFLNFVCFLPEWRAQYLYRIGSLGRILSILYPNRLALFFECNDIGGGLFIQHGHSTRIRAQRIGANCQIWQNVTIGKKKSGGGVPNIGQNVQICTGACVLGEINIGDNVIVGANAVVLTDIPNNCIAVGVPARIIPQK